MLSYGFDLPLHGTLAPQDPNLMLQYMQLCSATDDPAVRVGDIYNLWLEEPGFLNLVSDNLSFVCIPAIDTQTFFTHLYNAPHVPNNHSIIHI